MRMLKAASPEKQSSANSPAKENISSRLYKKGRKIIVGLHKIAENNSATSKSQWAIKIIIST